MPATEAGAEERELGSYELAFHILPTVAEGEVATVAEGLKGLITKLGGTVISEEAPARFDLAYEIVKYLEGRNRKFSSAYFGWVRFSIGGEHIEEIGNATGANKAILRHLLIKLTKVEEENTFFFHESLEKKSPVKTIDLDEEVEGVVVDDSDILVADVEIDEVVETKV